MAEPQVRIRTWVRGSPAERATGLLGYVSLYIGNLVVDGITLRRKLDGGFTLAWPAKTDRSGRRHPTARPADDVARRAVEREVFRQLGQRAALDAPAEDRDE